ncbi:UTP--glucose-1-phosphate uridylyltransferase [Bacillus solimangrovi]|uniref:UTP--glucose-1-phosphate uridylyltransferase n=1 Tax=Bacillus solimangrovi TaxID=1305675 RepID=A0A1E5LG36_9BACI|nr:UTP--glucose-1-phosphate uridylyltransferase [Bacillus solimangrovi]OEH93041.1 UTP--glucose-1-phosphate uridylyltransferase [Bacillus solimangrovi]
MIKKAIIPAAGYGTRNLPITKVLPKEMFPIGVKPAIQYVIEEALESGIEDILLVVSRSKNLIVDYFDESLELEAFLERNNKEHLLSKMQIPKQQLYFTRQPYARGLGDAIRIGERFINNEPFAVLLPDDIIMSKGKHGLCELIDVYKKKQSSVIGLKEIEQNMLHQYGVIKGKETKSGIYKMKDIIEKPKKNPPSNLAAVGRYIFTPAIFSHLNDLQYVAGQEIQLTDAIRKLLINEKCYGKILSGKRYDIATPKDYLDIINKVHYLNNM